MDRKENKVERVLARQTAVPLPLNETESILGGQTVNRCEDAGGTETYQADRGVSCDSRGGPN